jgi:hypothetical protein
VQADGEKQLPVVGITQVKVVQHLVRQLAPSAVQDQHVGAVERGVHRHEHLAQGQPYHGFADAAGSGHVDRGELDQ